MGWFYTSGEFFKAVDKGDCETVAKYLKKNQKRWATEKNASYLTAIEIAYKKKHTKLFDMLLAISPQPEPENFWDSPLHTAARDGNIDIVKKCLARWPGSVNLCAPYTPIHRALNNKRTDVVKLLLEQKDVDFSVCNYTGDARNMACYQLLIDAGCSPLTPDIRKDGSRYYPLSSAAEYSDLDVVKAMLDAGVKVDEDSTTPLLSAARNGRTDVTALLLKHGARAGMSEALIEAKKENHYEIYNLLLGSIEKATMSALSADGPTWKIAHEIELVHVRTYPDQHRRLTEIFNFERQDYILISENTAEKIETTSLPESFGAIGETALEIAWSKFKELGGSADESRVFKNRVHILKKTV